MTARNQGTATNATTLPRVVLAAAPLVIALICMSAAFAEGSATVDCEMRFQLSNRSPVYERVDGTGMVACTDGTSLPVFIRAQGGGLTTGRPKVTSATGVFTDVHEISDVLGTYAPGDVDAGVMKSAAVRPLTNGKASLGLAGTGEGYDLVFRISGLTIWPQ